MTPSSIPAVRRVARTALAASLVATSLTGLVAPAVPAFAQASPTVTADVRTDTPQFLDGAVFDFAQIGDTIVVGGTFTRVYDVATGTTRDQRGVAAYSRSTGALRTDFLPSLNGDVFEVEASEDGTAVYIGGTFTNIDGVIRERLALLDGSGEVDPTFHANVSAMVDGLAVGNGTVYVGGSFLEVNGVDRDQIAAVHADTGALDTGFELPITVDGGRSSRSVRALDLTPDMSRLLVVHAGLFVDGVSRPGVAMVDVSGPTATLTGWRSTLLEQNACGGKIRWKDGEISPDGTYFVVVSQGGDRPPVCDVAVRFPVSDGEVEQDWISRHFDSVFSVGISETAVYTGGHFYAQEAPGSPDPYPGGKDTNHSCTRDGGTDCGWTILGDQVTPRAQVGALDPATGKTLDWNPGTNAYVAVYGLEVIDDGLLLGHDRDIIDGRTIGRSGLFDDRSAPQSSPDTTMPTGSQILPTAGAVVEPGRTIIRGQASDDRKITGVLVAVQDAATGTWLQGDGTFGAYVQMQALIDEPGQATTGWEHEVDLAPGSYRIRTRVRDGGGNQSDVVASRFDVVEPNATPNDGPGPDPTPTPDERPVDAAAPVVDITSHEDRARARAGEIVLSGIASDDLELSQVIVSIRDRKTGDWLRPDGSWGDWQPLVATMDRPGEIASTWKLALTLPAGRYRVIARAVDGINQDSAAAQVRLHLG